MQARLFRVEEVTEPGILPAGRYMFAVDSEIMVDIELRAPMRPRDLRPLIVQAFARAA